MRWYDQIKCHNVLTFYFHWIFLMGPWFTKTVLYTLAWSTNYSLITEYITPWVHTAECKLCKHSTVGFQFPLSFAYMSALLGNNFFYVNRRPLKTFKVIVQLQNFTENKFGTVIFYNGMIFKFISRPKRSKAVIKVPEHD